MISNTTKSHSHACSFSLLLCRPKQEISHNGHSILPRHSLRLSQCPLLSSEMIEFEVSSEGYLCDTGFLVRSPVLHVEQHLT